MTDKFTIFKWCFENRVVLGRLLFSVVSLFSGYQFWDNTVKTDDVSMLKSQITQMAPLLHAPIKQENVSHETSCGECKKALKTLDYLKQTYHPER